MRVITTGVDGEGKSCVISDEEVAAFDKGGPPFVWDSDSDALSRLTGLIADDHVPEGVEPAGVARLFAGEIDPTRGDAPPSWSTWHATRTLDFYYVVRGRVTLDLDKETVDADEGDLIIQQATHHRWRAEGPFRFFCVVFRL
jgi:mannose-6-phosphate isomerase-like protein (cupin superfamily)